MFKKYDGYPSRIKKPKYTEKKEKKEKKKKVGNDNITKIIEKFEQKAEKKAVFITRESFTGHNSPGRTINYKKRIIFNLPVLIGLLSGAFIAVLVIIVSVIFTDFRNVKALSDFQPNITTKIFDKNGLLISELFRQKREVVELKDMPSDVKNAFIAAEDAEFYDHFGINISGIVRAFIVDIFSGSIRQGGSTITQQLAKILLTNRERTVLRKIKEIVIALMIEYKYDKDEILSLYLNQIFLGHGTYGVESASRFYFNKHVKDLNLAESSLLAVLTSAPNKLSPIRYPEKAIAKHERVLARMVDCGFVTIKDAESAFLKFWPEYLDYINDLPPTMTSWSNKVDKAPWFTEYIRRNLIKEFGEDAVYREGLSVYTTLDLKKQIAAQDLMYDALEKQQVVSSGLSFKNEDYLIENYSDDIEMMSLLFDVNPDYKSGSLEFKKLNDYLQKEIDELDIMDLLFGMNRNSDATDVYRENTSDHRDYIEVEGCLISIDHRTGYIEAMVGGKEFSSINQLNRVMQIKRQPGSAIKPLLYLAAMESKQFTPSTVMVDAPVIFPDSEGMDWIPDNYDEVYQGNVRLRTALSKSINSISIRIAESLGIEYVMNSMARLLKIDGPEAKKRIPRNFSIALGSLDVEPFELARAYAIIANMGKDVIPFSIRYVKDRNGNAISNTEEKIKEMISEKDQNGTIQIVSQEAAAVMINVLASVMSSGTGVSANFGWPACGKTGTTNNWTDAWFVGFSPVLTTCVWMGYDNPEFSLGIGQAGGVVSAPVWGSYMKAAHEQAPVRDFPAAGGILHETVCAVSGLLPSPYCTRTINEIFIEGTVPEAVCEVCRDQKYGIDPQKSSPRKNIAESQRESILKKIKEKDEDSSVLDGINDLNEDLLK